MLGVTRGAEISVVISDEVANRGVVLTFPCEAALQPRAGAFPRIGSKGVLPVPNYEATCLRRA